VIDFNANNLADEPSRHLQQHASNPIHWQVWNHATLRLAQQQSKPILVSIGYSTCHWCQKMNRESFSDTITAKILNQYFTCIKVDQEQQSDVDKYYQRAFKRLNNYSGGWPLNIFLDPKTLSPFFAGGYFPLIKSDNQNSFKEILVTIEDIYRNKPDDVKTMLTKVEQPFIAATATNKIPTNLLVNRFINEFEQHIDKEWGGIQTVPKFPQASLFHTLLNIIVSERPEASERLYQSLMLTTQSMARVGLFDHVGGGFFHHSTDSYWGIPHFEKLISLNAVLQSLYADLAKFNKEGSLSNICFKIYQWLDRDMRSPDGAFINAINSDAEDKEGAYYVFTNDEIEQLLTEDEWLIARVAFGLDRAANFNDHWHIHQWYSNESLAKKLNLEVKQVQWMLEPIKDKLLNYRQSRLALEIDDTVIVSSNALLISSLLKTGQLLNNESIVNSGLKALNSLIEQCYQGQKLYRSINQKTSSAYQLAMLDDYAYLIQALLGALSYQWQDDYYELVVSLTDQALELFYQADGNCLNYTSDPLVTANYNSDDALPNAQAMFIKCLVVIAQLSNNPIWYELAQVTIENAVSNINDSLLSYPSLIDSYLTLKHSRLIVIRGSALETLPWKDQLTVNYKPYDSVFAITNEAALPNNKHLNISSDTPLVILCEKLAYSKPVTNIDDINNRAT
jgi:uncharacterized protein YyaL (SSP411 family)